MGAGKKTTTLQDVNESNRTRCEDQWTLTHAHARNVTIVVDQIPLLGSQIQTEHVVVYCVSS